MPFHQARQHGAVHVVCAGPELAFHGFPVLPATPSPVNDDDRWQTGLRLGIHRVPINRPSGHVTA
ncbi:MAG: hypothetical protein OER90_10880, partial [Gemmatimonadota bacterium]|nr:hypothetical protein [Gemmatimonadota bacterium]